MTGEGRQNGKPAPYGGTEAEERRMYILDNSSRMERSALARAVIYKNDGTISEKEREVLREHRLHIFLNERLIMKLVCTPELVKELVIGRLVTEGCIRSVEEIEELYICDSAHTAKVYLKDGENIAWSDGIQEEPTCCTDNRVYAGSREEFLTPFSEKKELCIPGIFAWTQVLKEDSMLHRSTGGTHSCCISVGNRLLFSAEDIGRHNAMDKVIGYARLEGYAPEDCMLFTTGRVPVDMVRKAIAAKIPVLVSKAVPTLEAVELAEAYRLRLVCKAWPDQFEVFV